MDFLISLLVIAAIVALGIWIGKRTHETRKQMIAEMEDEPMDTPVAIEPEPVIEADPVAVEMPHIEAKVKPAAKKRRGRPKNK